MNRVKKIFVIFTMIAFGLMAANPVLAHFGLVKPSDNIITQEDNKTYFPHKKKVDFSDLCQEVGIKKFVRYICTFLIEYLISSKLFFESQ